MLKALVDYGDWISVKEIARKVNLGYPECGLYSYLRRLEAFGLVEVDRNPSCTAVISPHGTGCHKAQISKRKEVKNLMANNIATGKTAPEPRALLPPMFPLTVELRIMDKGKLRGIADVTITLGDWGTARFSGFAIFSDGGAPHVAPPSKQGKSKYFDVVTLNGPIRRAVDEAIIAEFERLKK